MHALSNPIRPESLSVLCPSITPLMSPLPFFSSPFLYSYHKPRFHTDTDAMPQSFYAQIREIEAETGCYFDDIFMVDTERAVDYAKVWVDTFQRHQSPCEGLGLG